MKRLLLVIVISITSNFFISGKLRIEDQALAIKAKSTNGICGVHIGDRAPAFKARSTKGIVNFPSDYQGKYVILFSHPADFTPVCKTEFKRLAGLAQEFKSMNTELVGLSVDSEFTHEIWIRSLEKEMKKEGFPKRTVTFPVIADRDRKIAQKYGMIHPLESKTQTVRSVFIIDPKGKIRAMLFYPISIGRSFKGEVKRLLAAVQISDAQGVATPEDWQPGKPTISKEKVLKDILPE